MTLRWEVEAPRLAALARLHLSADEVAELARACEAITREFAQLEAYARDLPEAPGALLGPLRADELAPAPPGEADAILAAAPRTDKATRAVLVPRGAP